MDRKIYTNGALTLDLTTKAVRVAGERVRLTRREADVACYLAEHAGRWVGNQELVERVCGVEVCDESLVRVHIYALRKKLGVAGGTIETQRGFGYRLPAGETDEDIAKYRRAYFILMHLLATWGMAEGQGEQR